MELSKLHQHTNKAFKNRQKLKYYSLGVIPPTLVLSNQIITQQMIDMDSCIHEENDRQVLNGDFPDYIPESDTSNINKLYTYFITAIQKRQNENNQYPKNNNTALMSEIKKRESDFKISKFKLKNHWPLQKSSTFPDELAQRIYEEVQKKCSLKRFKVLKFQKQLKKLYQQMQQLCQKLLKYKNVDTMDNDSFRIKTSMSISMNMNISTQISYPLKRFTMMEQIQKEIGQKKAELINKQDQCQKLMRDEKLLIQQKLNFLFLLLKNAHHITFNKGIFWVLQKLAENQQILCSSDLYQELDDLSKTFLLEQYDKIKRNISMRKNTYFHKNIAKDRQKKQKQQFNALPSIGPARLMNIEKNDSRKKIYIESQNYIVDWVRNQRWKVRSLKHKPEEKSQRKDWRVTQIKRLKQQYSKQKSSNLLRYIFGDINSINQTKFQENKQQDLSRRKHVSQLKRNKSKSDIERRKYNMTIHRLKSMA